MATNTHKTTAGTWYSVHCTAAATLTAEIDGEEIPVCSLDEAGSTVFCAPDAHVTITTEGNYRILPTKAPGADVTGGATSKALKQHIADTTVHITAAERTSWNTKTDDTALNTHKADTVAHLTSAEHDGLAELLSGGGIACLPDSTFNSWAFKRTGKVYGVRLYLAENGYTSSTIPSSVAESKILANAGLNHTCSTDTVEGADDYADIHLFSWFNCNYIRLDDGSPRPTALEGQPEYATTGSVDVGVIGPTFWWGEMLDLDNLSDTGVVMFKKLLISDSPHPELGLKPWRESLRGSGDDITIAPYYIHSKYMGGTASDGLQRSQPGLAPTINMSHNGVLSTYQKKGKGYWGGGMCINTFGMIFDLIKSGGNKNSQGIHAGCAQYHVTYASAISERTDELAAFPLSKSNADFIVVGSCVNIGTANGTDRSSSTSRNVAANATVTGKENVYDTDGTTLLYVNVLLDCTPFAITSTIYLQTTHWRAGSTDAVIGKHDGSYGSLTDSKHPYRVQGTEYAVGTWTLAADSVSVRDSEGNITMYVAKPGISHSTEQATITANYKAIGSMPTVSGYSPGDMELDGDTGGMRISYKVSSDSQGYLDYYWTSGSTGSFEVLYGGTLNRGALAGSAALACCDALALSSWNVAARD